MLAHRGIRSRSCRRRANNIAKSVGILGPVADVIGSWHTGRRVPLDLGVVDGAWGRRYFVEAVGGGLIPSAFAEMQARSNGNQLPTKAKLTGAVRAVGDVLSRLQPVEWTVVADGARTTRKLILVEVLNICSIGPNLVFSADANLSDGVFRVVHAGGTARYGCPLFATDSGRTSLAGIGASVTYDAARRDRHPRGRRGPLQFAGRSTIHIEAGPWSSCARPADRNRLGPQAGSSVKRVSHPWHRGNLLLSRSSNAWTPAPGAASTKGRPCPSPKIESGKND